MPVTTEAATSGPQTIGGVSRWLIVLGGVIGLITAATLQRTNDWDVNGYIVWSLVHGLVYLLAVWWVLHRPTGRCDFVWILFFALGFRAISLFSEPALSTDVFRYVWDGRIQAAGVNPYQYVPADPALQIYRDADIYPHINKKEIAHTIYPPTAQITFLIGASLKMGITGMKVVGFVFDVLTIAGLVYWLSIKSLPTALVLIYAWHPLPIWEFTSQAHIDGVATAWMVWAIVAAEKKCQGWAGVALSAAVLVKYFPIAIFPAIWKRWDWRMPAAMIATAVVLYAPYVWTADAPVSGFLAKHLDAEGYGQGWGFHPVWFIRWVGLGLIPGGVYLAGAVAVLGLLGVWAFFARRADAIQPGSLMLLGGAFAYLSSPHYPWYLGFLVALSVMRPHVMVLTMTVFCTVLQVPRGDDGFSWTEPFALTYLLPVVIWLGVSWQRRRGRLDN